MGLVTPELGLSIWTAVAFLILLVLLRVFAWRPILDAVKAREESISNALSAAEDAKAEMAKLTASNEELLKEAHEQRDHILKQAKELQDKMVTEAKDKAKAEANKIIIDAKESIHLEKQAAIVDLKNQVASLSIEIAEKIVKEQLNSADKQKALADTLAKEVTLN